MTLKTFKASKISKAGSVSINLPKFFQKNFSTTKRLFHSKYSPYRFTKSISILQNFSSFFSSHKIHLNFSQNFSRFFLSPPFFLPKISSIFPTLNISQNLQIFRCGKVQIRILRTSAKKLCHSTLGLNFPIKKEDFFK